MPGDAMAPQLDMSTEPVLDQAQSIAKAPRTAAATPFLRHKNGRWYFDDMTQREGLIGAIY